MNTLDIASKTETKRLDTQELRNRFLIEDLFEEGKINLTYCDADRAIVGGVCPAESPLALEVTKELRTNYLCERRELGIVNLGEPGSLKVDGQDYSMEKQDCLYVGRGSKEILLEGKGAKFYLISYPAHKEYPTTKASLAEANPVAMGSQEACNERVIYQYIHENGIKSCQLMLGITLLKPGSIWNTMPAHTHDRRSEIYMYFDLPADNTVFHFMGEPQQTRHLCIHNHQAVVSPAWSIHSGAGTSNYGFIWAMGGENQRFDDMDLIPISELR